MNDAHEKGHMYQGDIDLTDEQLALLTGNETARLEMRQVILRNHWPRVGNRITIPYTTSVNFEESERANIARAFEEYEKHTCIRYRKFNNECLKFDYVDRYLVFTADDNYGIARVSFILSL